MPSEFPSRVSGIANSMAVVGLVRKLVWLAICRVPEEKSAAGLVALSTWLAGPLKIAVRVLGQPKAHQPCVLPGKISSM